jgi:hypothetical protein
LEAYPLENSLDMLRIMVSGINEKSKVEKTALMVRKRKSSDSFGFVISNLEKRKNWRQNKAISRTTYPRKYLANSIFIILVELGITLENRVG